MGGVCTGSIRSNFNTVFRKTEIWDFNNEAQPVGEFSGPELEDYNSTVASFLIPVDDCALTDSMLFLYGPKEDSPEDATISRIINVRKYVDNTGKSYTRCALFFGAFL